MAKKRTTEVDTMIEGWAKGLGKGARTSIDKTDAGDLAGFSLSTEDPIDPLDLEAARAIQTALAANTGRKKGLWTWLEVAKKALGGGRMKNGQWDRILKAGYDARLFELDESGSFPTLKVLAEVLEEPPKPDEVEEASPKPFVIPPIPKNWDPPGILACGHMDWYLKKENKAAKKEGHCCEGGRRKLVPFWHVRGLTHPVPKRSQRVAGGFEGGLCCDPKTDLYIGGLGNDCRFNGGKKRCSVHRK